MRDDSAELTAELIVDGVVPRTPVISPDGRWVAYAAAPAGRPAERDLAALWLAAADGSTPPRPLTDGSAADDQLAWAPDSAWLWFRPDRGGSAQLYRTGPDGREPGALTGWGGGITAALPLAGGRLAAVIAADEPTAAARLAIADRDDAIVWDRRVPPDRLRLLDLNTGEWRVVAGLGDRHVVEIAQRPDGGPLAVISWAGPEIDPGEVTNELHMVDPATGSARDLGRAGTGAASLAWWRDGGPWHLAYVATPGPNGGRAVLDLIIPEAGTSPAGHANLTGGLTACPVSLAPVADGPPLALFADGLDSAIYRLDPARSAFRLQSAWPGWAEALTASRSGAVIAVLASAAPEPADVYAGRPDRPLRRLSDSRPALRRVRWGAQERLTYRAADGLGLDGLLILPPGRSRAGGPFPMVTLVHGGPYGRFADQLMIDPHAPGQWLAAGGYAVFLPNPRGGQGHGHAFAAAASGTIGVGDWADILTGIDLLVTRRGGRPGPARDQRLGDARRHRCEWRPGGRAGRQLWLGGTRPAPARPDQPGLLRRPGPHPGADPARRGRHQRAAQPGRLLPPGAPPVRRRARVHRLPARGARGSRARSPARCPAPEPGLVRPLAPRPAAGRSPAIRLSPAAASRLERCLHRGTVQ